MKRWSKEEIKILEENINQPLDVLLKILPKRTKISIISKKDKLHLKRKSSFYWKNEDDNFLINNYHKTPIQIISSKLNKSYQAIYNRRNRLIKKGMKFEDKSKFRSNYWKKQYKTNKELIKKHKLAIKKLFSDSEFNKRRIKSIKKKFEDPIFLEDYIKKFKERRNSNEFRRKQEKAASKYMRIKHKNPIEHKKMLENMRKNPSNQQILVANKLKERYGKNNVGCNDWKILEGFMEVDIPIYPLKTAIEWDGKYWHSEKKIKEKDYKKNKELFNKGWKVIRIIARSNPPLSEKEIINSIPKIMESIDKEKKFQIIEVK